MIKLSGHDEDESKSVPGLLTDDLCGQKGLILVSWPYSIFLFILVLRFFFVKYRFTFNTSYRYNLQLLTEV